jgi:hypothetical protein
VGWSVEGNLFYGILVCLNYALYTVTFRIENVTIKSEAVVGCLCVGWDCGAESKCRDLLIMVIVLKDTSYRFDRI